MDELDLLVIQTSLIFKDICKTQGYGFWASRHSSQKATLCFAGFGVLTLFQSLRMCESPKALELHPWQHALTVEGSVLYLIYMLMIFKG